MGMFDLTEKKLRERRAAEIDTAMLREEVREAERNVLAAAERFFDGDPHDGLAACVIVLRAARREFEAANTEASRRACVGFVGRVSPYDLAGIHRAARERR